MDFCEFPRNHNFPLRKTSEKVKAIFRRYISKFVVTISFYKKIHKNLL